MYLSRNKSLMHYKNKVAKRSVRFLFIGYEKK